MVSFLIFKSVKNTIRRNNRIDIDNPAQDAGGWQSILLRMLTSYVQVLGMIGRVDVRWPSVLQFASRADEVATLANSDALSLDCLFDQFKGDVDAYYFRAIIFNLIPLVMALASVLFWVFWWIVKK